MGGHSSDMKNQPLMQPVAVASHHFARSLRSSGRTASAGSVKTCGFSARGDFRGFDVEKMVIEPFGIYVG